MITYNNDEQSEIWDAKRFIRKYVNVNHLVSHICQSSDLSFFKYVLRSNGLRIR